MIFVTITSLDAPIPKVIRSISDMFLENSISGVNMRRLADRSSF